ncbi:MAG: MFS transporter [Bacteroidia bacterium]
MKKSLLPIILTVFLDMLGVGIVIPIAAPLLLGTNYALFSPATDFSTRAIYLGFLFAAYPLAQFFGAPLLGALADKYGRKKLLRLSLIGTLIGYFLFAAGIWVESLPILFISRIIDGFTGGNIAIAMSAISDISDEKEKAKNFGIIGAFFGVGFILGPYIGGKLADNTLVSWFDLATPYLFAALLSFINLILIQFRFEETLKKPSTAPLDWTTGFKNIKKAFSLPNLRTIFTVVFLLTFGFSFFTQFIQVFCIKKFQYTESNIADFFAYAGIWIFVTQGLFLRQLTRYFSPRQIVGITCLTMTIAIFCMTLPQQSLYLYYIMPFLSISHGLTMPNTTAIVSQQADATQQGEILGMNQSMQSLGHAIPPLIGGYFTSIDINLPIWAAAAFILLAWMIFVMFFRPHQETAEDFEGKIAKIGEK